MAGLGRKGWHGKKRFAGERKQQEHGEGVGMGVGTGKGQEEGWR